jgi:hypothetical protein
MDHQNGGTHVESPKKFHILQGFHLVLFVDFNAFWDYAWKVSLARSCTERVHRYMRGSSGMFVDT